MLTLRNTALEKKKLTFCQWKHFFSQIFKIWKKKVHPLEEKFFCNCTSAHFIFQQTFSFWGSISFVFVSQSKSESQDWVCTTILGLKTLWKICIKGNFWNLSKLCLVLKRIVQFYIKNKIWKGLNWWKGTYTTWLFRVY